MLYKEAEEIFNTVMQQIDCLYAPTQTKEAASIPPVSPSIMSTLLSKLPEKVIEQLANHPDVRDLIIKSIRESGAPVKGMMPSHNLYYALGAGAGLGAGGYGIGKWHEGAKHDWEKLKYGLGGYGAGLATPYAYNMLTGKGTGSIGNLTHDLAQRIMPNQAQGQAENLPFADFTSI